MHIDIALQCNFKTSKIWSDEKAPVLKQLI